MRLFLYLLALVAGMSPAQASRIALSEPVAVGAVAPIAVSQSAHPCLAKRHHSHLACQDDLAPIKTAGHLAVLAEALPQISIILTDRPRA